MTALRSTEIFGNAGLFSSSEAALTHAFACVRKSVLAHALEKLGDGKRNRRFAGGVEAATLDAVADELSKQSAALETRQLSAFGRLPFGALGVNLQFCHVQVLQAHGYDAILWRGPVGKSLEHRNLCLFLPADVENGAETAAIIIEFRTNQPVTQIAML